MKEDRHERMTCEWSAEPKVARLRACVYFLHLSKCITLPEKRVLLDRIARSNLMGDADLNGDGEVFKAKRSHKKKASS